MDLARALATTTTRLTGKQSFDLIAGKSLKIETSPQGIDILNDEVPAGKVWGVTVKVIAYEKDA